MKENNYYQPLKNDGGYEMPDGLHSFQAFCTKEDCQHWLKEHNIENDFDIVEYRNADIEDVTILDKNGDPVFVDMVVSDIEYDLDGSECMEDYDLPESITISVPLGKTYIDFYLNEYINDHISDETGFCICGYTTNLDSNFEDDAEEDKELEVRVTFRSEVFIKGKSMADIKCKWHDLPIFSADALEECHAAFVELVSAERVDDNSYKEVDLD